MTDRVCVDLQETSGLASVARVGFEFSTREHPMGSKSARWGAAIGGAFLAQLVLIAATIAWVAFYSHVVAPGQQVSAYHAHAQQAGPWVSLLCGVPLFILLCRWIGRQQPQRALATTLALLTIYLLVDVAILLAAAGAELPIAMIIANYVAKVLAGIAGGRSAALREAT
jgi:hypothetical protein